MTKFILAILILVSFAPLAHAANWYVSKTSTGTHNGTSWTNAWVDFSSISYTSVACGDTIWVAGGSTYTTNFVWNKTCTSGNVLTFKGPLATDAVPVASAGWSTAFDVSVNPVLATNAAVTLCCAFITIDGRVGDAGVGLAYGMKFSYTSDGWTGAWNTSTSVNTDDFIVSHVEILGPPCAVTGAVCNNSNWGVNVCCVKTNTNFTLDHVWVHQWPEIIRPYQSTNLTIQYSYIGEDARVTNGDHEDLVYLSDPVTNMVIHDTTLYESGNDGVFMDNNGASGATFYNDIFFHNAGWQISLGKTGTCGPYKIYTSIFESDGTNGEYPYAWLGTGGCTVASGTDMKDNILYNTIADASSSGAGIDAIQTYMMGTSANGQSFPTSCTGCSSYSAGSPLTAFTGWVNMLATPIQQSDFHLTTAGKTLFQGKGLNLTSTVCTTIPGVCVDRDGNTRPTSGNWTLGPFEAVTLPNVATPTASPAAGTYSGAQTVAITSATSGTTLCVTTNGATPTAPTAGTCGVGTTLANGGTIVVSASETVQALGTLSGDNNSAVASFAYTINHQTWYVRQDGGTITQCTGKVDAAYSGSGTGQPCGVKDLRWLYDNQTFDDWQSNGSSWIIAGGDTVILESAASVPAVTGLQAASASPANRIGWDYGQSCSGAGCASGFTWCFGVGQCGIPPLPAGTPSAPTHFWGANHGACSTTTTFPGAFVSTIIPDPTKMFEFYGDFSLNTTMDLTGTHDIDIQCVHITTHGDCIVHISPNPNPCSSSIPLSSYSSEGIRTGPTTGAVSLTDVWISGFQDSGWFGPIDTSATFSDVRFSYNVMTGFNMDDGTDVQAGGTVTTNYLTLDFNGCNQKWPFVTTVPIDICSDQNSSGDGDGVATPGSSSDVFINDHTTAIYNTQDGYDIGHNQAPGSASWNHSVMYGNMGGTFKSGGESSTLINSVSIQNCFRMDAAITGVPTGFNSQLSLWCRAGDGVTANWLGGGSGEVIKFQDNAIVTYGNDAIDLQIQGTGVCTGCTALTQGNVFLAYNNPSTGLPHNPVVYGNSGPTTTDHNTFFNFFGFTCTGTDQCVDPLFVSEPPPATNVGNGGLDAFNFNLSSSSPAKTSQIPISGITDDFFGVTRLNPTSAGAAQFIGGLTPPTALSGKVVISGNTVTH